MSTIGDALFSYIRFLEVTLQVDIESFWSIFYYLALTALFFMSLYWHGQHLYQQHIQDRIESDHQ